SSNSNGRKCTRRTTRARLQVVAGRRARSSWAAGRRGHGGRLPAGGELGLQSAAEVRGRREYPLLEALDFIEQQEQPFAEGGSRGEGAVGVVGLVACCQVAA